MDEKEFVITEVYIEVLFEEVKEDFDSHQKTTRRFLRTTPNILKLPPNYTTFHVYRNYSWTAEN